MARILVIDDQPAMRRSVRRILEAHGHEVTEEPDGHVALRHFAGNPTEVVITDVFMPNMDGIDFVMRVRDTFPEARLIVMSGGGVLPKEDVLVDAAALGADATLEKPFTPELLIDTLDRVLSTEPRQFSQG